MVIHRFCALYRCCHCLRSSRMESLSAMFKTGLYINDLSMHDSSRDLVLAGTQQSEELKRALIQVHLRRVISSHVTLQPPPQITYTRDEREQIAISLCYSVSFPRCKRRSKRSPVSWRRA